jgi:glucose/arabinose dehydrogenase
MALRRHLTPVVMMIVFLLLARQIYPYSTPSNDMLVEGYSIDKVTDNLGGPTCLEWADQENLLVCDRDGDRIILLNSSNDFTHTIILEGLDHPHGLHITTDYLFVSEAGILARYDRGIDWQLSNRTVLVDGIKTTNSHQTNAINALPNGSLIWHVGSTCNVCQEDDNRNAALLWVDPETGDHGVIASGVRNSFDGVWIESMGYVFTDNGRDWDGDHPPEEINLLIEGESYGWPDDEPETPVPEGTQGPIAIWTPHSLVNGIDLRPENSSLPGLNQGAGYTVYATVYGSWNTLIPKGNEIIRVDFTPAFTLDGNFSGWDSEVSVFAENLGTPLPITFGPSGDLYYATFGGDGTLYRISSTQS